ncbi:MAG: hypothetical protein M3Q58_01145 [Bacteroidota bacterium]|nr:hypothetical protein [Bacteroidota bacterium]
MKKIIYIMVTGLLLSCGNQTEIIEKKDNSTAEILSQLEKKSEFFTFSIDSIPIIIGLEGTVITIPSECLVHQDDKLPKGEVTIELKEFYSASDILFNNLTTQTKSGLLQTAGMIYIQATSENKVLKVKDGKSFEIKFPIIGNVKKGMQLYRGKIEKDFISWDDTPISDSAMTINLDLIREGVGLPSQRNLDYYIFESGITWWINCDKQLEGADKTILSIKIDTVIIPHIRIVFPSLKTAAAPLFEDGTLNFYNIPLEESGTIIGFYKSENKHYIYKKEITISAKMKETAVFREVTLEELKAEIEAIKWKESV